MKIKMSDVTSGSANVKAVFRESMVARTARFLQRFTFSEAELLEIARLAEVERHNDRKRLLHLVILSQSGPFSPKVFEQYLENAFVNNETLMYLLTNSTGLTDDHRERIITKSMYTGPGHFIPNFYMNGECNKYGIDVKKSPFNARFAKDYVWTASTPGRKIYETDSYNNFLFEVLDTLSPEALMTWFEDDLKQKIFRFDLLLAYKNCPLPLFTRLFEISNTNEKNKLAKAETCPIEIKMRMFEETGDMSYLPISVREMFDFNFTD